MKVLAVGGLIACLISVPALASCIAPQPPAHLPDGASATREDMVAALKAIKAYETAVKDFSDCAKQTTDEIQMQIADRAVEKLASIAEKFNSELYAFKKRNGV